jgi:hypothetical protein
MKQNKNKNKLPDGHYRLSRITIREITDKYPDKIMEIVDRKRDIVLVLDTCRILFTK